MKKIFFLIVVIQFSLTILSAQQNEDVVWIVYSEHAATPKEGLKALPRLTYASESIEAEGNVKIDAGNAATFRTGTTGQISLMGHFHVEKGAFFLAHKGEPEALRTTEEPEALPETSSVPVVNARPSVITMGIRPNPFTDHLTIDLVLETQSQVQVRIYDATGRLVREVVREKQLPVGRHQAKINTSNFAPGMYFCEVITDTRQFRKTIVCAE